MCDIFHDETTIEPYQLYQKYCYLPLYKAHKIAFLDKKI